MELLFKLILIDGILGKSNYYAIKVEFRIPSNPHIHSFIWITGSRKLTSDNVDEYINWLEKIILASLPDLKFNSNLNEFVKGYQTHRHSKTCRKQKL